MLALGLQKLQNFHLEKSVNLTESLSIMKELVQFPYQPLSGRAVVVYWHSTLFYRCTIELNRPGLDYRTIDELSSM